MIVAEGKELIHDRIGRRIRNLSYLFRDQGILQDFYGTVRNAPNLDLGADVAPVPPFQAVVKVEDLARNVFSVGLAEYVNEQKRLMKFPQLNVPSTDYYRFLAIFDKTELDVIYRRYAALSTLALYSTVNFDVLLPIIKEKIAGELRTIEVESEVHSLSGTESDLIRRYTRLGVK